MLRPDQPSRSCRQRRYGVRATALAPAVVLAFRKDAAGDGLLQSRGLVLFQRVQIVESAAEEQQIGDLLDHLERIGNASGPEGVPDSMS